MRARLLAKKHGPLIRLESKKLLLNATYNSNNISIINSSIIYI